MLQKLITNYENPVPIDLKKLKNANIEFGTTLVAKQMEKENVQAINQ